MTKQHAIPQQQVTQQGELRMTEQNTQKSDPKPEGACEHIRKAPYTNGWYCNLLTYGTPLCSTCSNKVKDYDKR